VLFCGEVLFLLRATARVAPTELGEGCCVGGDGGRVLCGAERFGTVPYGVGGRMVVVDGRVLDGAECGRARTPCLASLRVGTAASWFARVWTGVRNNRKDGIVGGRYDT
jgi:hypothetical protein